MQKGQSDGSCTASSRIRRCRKIDNRDDLETGTKAQLDALLADEENPTLSMNR
jgi:hypothetical protein